MIAVIELDTRLLKLLTVQDELRNNRPDRLSDSKQAVAKALMTAVRAHKCNGCTTGQIEELERLTELLKGLV